MEEEKVAKIGKCPVKPINFNAPLLSTRRTNNSNSNNNNGVDGVEMLHANICERIPFSWEQIPGKPKAASRTEYDDEILPPKPPPYRWECAGSISKTIDDDNDKDPQADSDDGDEDERISSSNCGLDIFSLAQSADTIGTRDYPRRRRFEDYLELDQGSMRMMNPVASHSPTFMIERFLPDAKALAASSSALMNKKKSPQFHDPPPPPRFPTTCNDTPRAVSCLFRKPSSFSSCIGCGLHIFFPWRPKPKPHAVKSPIIPSPLSKARLQWARARSRLKMER